MATTILITGATGFIGSHVLEALRHSTARLVVAVRRPEALPAWFGGEVRVGDLRDPEYRESLVDGVDVICHCAAWSSLHGNETALRERFLRPTVDLLHRAQRAGVSRVVFPSTHAAGAPGADATAPGRAPGFWPHLQAVVAIENTLRDQSHSDFTGVTLRHGLFAGRGGGLGLLPALAPRLKTRLVPWVDGGRGLAPIIDGADIGQAFRLAATHPDVNGYEAFTVVGPSVPTLREVIDLLHAEFGLPRPWFGVPKAVAYPFAATMEAIDPVVPWPPLIVRAILHLLEDYGVSNDRVAERLGYAPTVDWRESVRAQMSEMADRPAAPALLRRAYD